MQSTSGLIQSLDQLLTDNANSEKKQTELLLDQNDLINQFAEQQQTLLKNQSDILSRFETQCGEVESNSKMVKDAARQLKQLRQKTDSLYDLMDTISDTVEQIQAVVDQKIASTADNTFGLSTANQGSSLVQPLVDGDGEHPSSSEFDGPPALSTSADSDLKNLMLLVQSLAESVNQNQATLAELNAKPRSESQEAEADEFDWQSQKKAFLQNHGSPTEAISSANTVSVDDSQLKLTTPADDQATAESGSESSTESPSATAATEGEPDEIREMRIKLEEKMRRAEIEISIERAKIARVRQELDEKKTELEREISRQQDDAQTQDGQQKKRRWKKFLQKEEDDAG